MNIAVWLDRLGLAEPGRPAIGRASAVDATYGEFRGRVARLAGGLRMGLGLAPGERVVIAARNCTEFLDLLHAIWWAGGAAVPVNAKLHGAELGYVAGHCGARIAFASDGIDTSLAAHAPPGLQHLVRIGSPAWTALSAAEPVACSPRESRDLAWLFYTSGTTGRPKGAMLTHGNLAAATFAYLAEVDPVAPGDVLLHAAPMSHGSGLYIMAHVMRGGVNLAPESGGFEPEEIFRLMAHWRRVSMFAAPTMVKRLTASPAPCDESAIRTIIYGGAPMYVEDALAAITRFGPRFAQIYGQGESPMTITRLSKAEIADEAHPLWRERLGGAGLPYGMMDVAVVDGEGRALPPGEAGEIICRGAPVMAGYLDDPEASARALSGGWLHTGDVGAFDVAGYLTLKDRSKDLIISGGANIYPREVEEVLLADPRVREVSVIGRPDPDWGENVVAYVVAAGGMHDAPSRAALVSALDGLCRERIARFKRPKDYVFVDSLPKNNYGKILKTDLRALDAKRLSDRQTSTDTEKAE